MEASNLIRAGGVALLGFALLNCGCNRAVESGPPGTPAAAPGPAATASPTPSTGPAPAPASTTNGTEETDVDALQGSTGAEVTRVLGKPQGQIHTRQGALWLYPHWRVQFDVEDRVLGIEKDFPIPLSALDPTRFAARPATATATGRPGTATAATPTPPQVVSNGGQEVDLLSLMPDGKVTVVDFYADWCGPCRQMAPHLERLAAQNPNVALLKIDIVDWKTPVTRQFGIRSIPDIRVYDLRKAQVGSATHDFSRVLVYVEEASR